MAMPGGDIARSDPQAEDRRSDNMVRIPGGTFRMGSDHHYPEEAPAHRVSVDSFWLDRTPVTNRQFKQFVKATGHKTFAEIPPDVGAFVMTFREFPPRSFPPSFVPATIMEETLGDIRDDRAKAGQRAQSIDKIRSGINQLIDQQLQQRGIK
jgi:formylglycine-generating enzyme required for sulfatase activity